MALRVIGAGLPRTGTSSLKVALERLLGGPCYHMTEVFPRPAHVGEWHRAARGEPTDFDALLDGFVAAVDWPASAVWKDLAAHWPDALILLSVRDPAAWFRSADATILDMFKRPTTWKNPAFREMTTALFHTRLTTDFLDADAMIEAAARHDADVRATAPPDRLLEWTAADGWAPLCAALGVPIPDAPFPHENTTSDFRSGLDRAPEKSPPS